MITDHCRREGAASRSRRFMVLFRHNDAGTSPLLRVVSGRQSFEYAAEGWEPNCRLPLLETHVDVYCLP